MSSSRRCPSHAAANSSAGFTLIELMVAVVVVAILAAVALPSFLDSVRKSRRGDAFKLISAVQQSEERWRSRNSSYSTSLTDLAVLVPSNAYYSIAVEAPPAPNGLGDGYIVMATATGSQTSDMPCAKLAARVVGGNLTYGGGSSSIDWTDANRCWAR